LKSASCANSEPHPSHTSGNVLLNIIGWLGIDV